MNALAVSFLVFACTFGAALIAMVLAPRLSAQHLTGETRDTIKVTMAMLATLAALVIGLLIGSVRGSYDNKDTELKRAAARIVALDRTLALYGSDADAIRAQLRQIVETRLKEIWSGPGDHDASPEAFRRAASFETIQAMLLQLTAKTDAQVWLKAKALSLVSDIAEGRWLLIQQLAGNIPFPVLLIVIGWLTIIYGSFGLYAPRNAVVIMALFVGAVSLAAAIYLLHAMDQPYGGLFALSGDAFRSALGELGRAAPP